MLSLHKGWLAFGVELDSYCERETSPQNASIPNVGMSSLLSSKLYGQTRAAATNASCTGGVGRVLFPAGCSNTTLGSCSSCGCPTGVTCSGTTTFVPFRPPGAGPGKHNFIGFGDSAGCSALQISTVQELGDVGGTGTTADIACDLNVDTYEMGVYGHISGNIYYGISIGHTGVLSSEIEKSATIPTADSNCS